MLCASVRRQPRGVGGDEGERGLLVAAIFRQIKMHAPDKIPGWVVRFEVSLQGLLRLGTFRSARGIDLLPQGLKHCSAEVLPARHGWRRGYERIDLVARWELNGMRR